MKLTNKKILVTGSDGFIGRNLVKRLIKERAKVIELNSSIDIRKWADIKKNIKITRDIDMVFHLAAVTFVPFSWENPRLTYETNILGTLNILELCRLCNVERLIFISSYLYGRPKYLPIDEKHPVDPTNPYAKSKLLAEELCKMYYKDYKIRIIILRPFNIFGEGQDTRFLIPLIINQVLKKKEINLKDPCPKRDFIYVEDMLDACIKAALYKNLKFDIFNIGMGKSYSVGEITEKILKIYGKKIRVNYSNEHRPHEIMEVVSDIKKARSNLGWFPKIGIDEGLKITFEKSKSFMKHAKSYVR